MCISTGIYSFQISFYICSEIYDLHTRKVGQRLMVIWKQPNWMFECLIHQSITWHRYLNQTNPTVGGTLTHSTDNANVTSLFFIYFFYLSCIAALKITSFCKKGKKKKVSKQLKGNVSNVIVICFIFQRNDVYEYEEVRKYHKTNVGEISEKSIEIVLKVNVI